MEHKLNMMKRSLHVVRWLLCYLTTVTVNTVCLTLTAIVHSTSCGHQATLQGGSSYHRHFTGGKRGYWNAKGPWQPVGLEFWAWQLARACALRLCELCCFIRSSDMFYSGALLSLVFHHIQFYTCQIFCKIMWLFLSQNFCLLHRNRFKILFCLNSFVNIQCLDVISCKAFFSKDV